MINENPITEIKAIAVIRGVCCASCKNSEKRKSDDGFVICNMHNIYQETTDFCSNFQPKPTNEKL